MTDRETLEAQALEEICPCQYWDLADGMDSMSDDELWTIIWHWIRCDMCGG